MKTIINKLDSALIIAITLVYFLYCANKGIVPSFETVLKIGSLCILFIASFIFILLPFVPKLNDWILKNQKVLVIIGLLILTLVIQVSFRVST